MKMKQSTDRIEVGKNRSVAACDSVAGGTVRVARGPHHNAIVKLFNGSVPTKWVSFLRYRHHHFMTSGSGLPDTVKKFPVHAHEKPAHAGRPAKRMVRADGEQHANEQSGWLEKQPSTRHRAPSRYVGVVPRTYVTLKLCTVTLTNSRQ